MTVLHSGKPVFTLYSSFFVTVYICLSLFFDPCCGVRVNYVLHPLTNGRRLCTWQCTKNMKEQYKHRNCILSYTSMQSSPTWMCVSSKNHITHVWDCTGKMMGNQQSWGKSTNANKYQKPKVCPSFTLAIIFSSHIDIQVILHGKIRGEEHVYIWHYDVFWCIMDRHIDSV